MPDATWRMTWPIVDLSTPLCDLLGDGMQDIAGELRRRVLRQAGPVRWSLDRGPAGFVLVGELPVETPARVDDPDEPHHARRTRTPGTRAHTPGEDVRWLLEQGETPAGIAQRLGITEDTVHRHRYPRHRQEAAT